MRTQPLPFASTPGFWLCFGSCSSVTPSVLAERSRARGKEGRAPCSLVPLESPAGPWNPAHSCLPCGGPRAGPASPCLFWPSAAVLTHRCMPEPQPGRARPLSVALGAAVRPGLTRGGAQHCPVGVSGRAGPLSVAPQSPGAAVASSSVVPVPSVLRLCALAPRTPRPALPAPTPLGLPLCAVDLVAFVAVTVPPLSPHAPCHAGRLAARGPGSVGTAALRTGP